MKDIEISYVLGNKDIIKAYSLYSLGSSKLCTDFVEYLGGKNHFYIKELDYDKSGKKTGKIKGYVYLGNSRVVSKKFGYNDNTTLKPIMLCSDFTKLINNKSRYFKYGVFPQNMVKSSELVKTLNYLYDNNKLKSTGRKYILDEKNSDLVFKEYELDNNKYVKAKDKWFKVEKISWTYIKAMNIAICNYGLVPCLNYKKQIKFLNRFLVENVNVNKTKYYENDKEKENEKKQIRNTLKRLMSLSNDLDKRYDDSYKLLYHSVPINSDLLLKHVEDHYEFDYDFVSLEWFKFIDFKKIDFTNVKVSGIDLSETNAKFNPQNVYNKDLSYGKYSPDNFTVVRKFDDVCIIGSDLSLCNYIDFSKCIDSEDTLY